VIFTTPSPVNTTLAGAPETFSSDGKRLAVANGNLVDEHAGETRLWDLATGASSHCLTGHARGVRDVRFSPDGRTLATMGEDGVIKLWDVPGGGR
jgi:WD40 repeat protein